MAATDEQARQWLTQKFLVSWRILNQVLVEKEAQSHKLIAISQEKNEIKIAMKN